ncbi:MAG: OmpA family protein [Bdellovibrionales bacterium]|nr:OmpA family protein [Bdellovibrionales bacterium]
MKMNLSGSTLRVFAVLGLITSMIAAPNARAVNSINVQTFDPSVGDRFVLLEDGFNGDWPKQAKYYFGANWNYASEPLVALNPTQTAKLFNVIDSIQTFDLMFGFKASKKFGLFIGLPIHFVSYPGTAGLISLPSGSASGVGDLKLLGKIRLTEDDNNTSVALVPEFRLPTGNTQNFMSDASTSAGIRLAVERQFESWTLDANFGMMFASNADYNDPTLGRIDWRKRLNIGVGGFLPFNDNWGMSAEYNANFPLPFSEQLNPNEFYAGLRYDPLSNWVGTFGASVGKIGGPSGLGLRVIAGIRVTLYEEKTPPPRPVYTPAPIATPAPTLAPTPEPAQVVVYHSTHVEVLREVTFEHASAKLTPDGKAILNQVAKVLEENKRHFTKIMVDGHTNRLGTDAYNMKLSLARAKSVKTYLISRGTPANALEARGYGYRKPKLPYSDPKAMEANRRVEFIVVK